MKRLRLKKLFAWPARIAVFIACGLLSVFLLMAGYESAYNRSLPFVHTVDPVDLTAYSQSYDLRDAGRNSERYGDFGKPTNVKLPERAARLDIGPAINSNGAWLARSNVLHLLIPTEPREGNIGLMLLYCRESFRTVNSQNAPAVGSNVFVDTDENWRYVYKVTSAKVYNDAVPYVVSDAGRTSKLLISCNDVQAGTNLVVEATLLSVQGIE